MSTKIDIESFVITSGARSSSAVRAGLQHVIQKRADERWTLRAIYGRLHQKGAEELFLVFAKKEK